MKKTTSKGYASIRSMLSSVTFPKFNVKTVFLILTILLVSFRLLHGYKVYCLVNEWCDVFTMLFHIDVTTIFGLGDFVFATYESKTDIFKTNSQLLTLVVKFCKRFPTLLLWSFILIVAAAFATVPSFDVWHFAVVAGQDYCIHKVVHFMCYDRSKRWYQCIKYINKFKRYIKKKVNSPNARSHEKE